MRDPTEHDPTDPALRRPIETAPHDGTVVQVGGPYEWVRCSWDGEHNCFVVYAPGFLKHSSAIDMDNKKFWRPDDGKG
jgi:hypothetical protein